MIERLNRDNDIKNTYADRIDAAFEKTFDIRKASALGYGYVNAWIEAVVLTIMLEAVREVFK